MQLHHGKAVTITAAPLFWGWRGEIAAAILREQLIPPLHLARSAGGAGMPSSGPSHCLFPPQHLLEEGKMECAVRAVPQRLESQSEPVALCS